MAGSSFEVSNKRMSLGNFRGIQTYTLDNHVRTEKNESLKASKLSGWASKLVLWSHTDILKLCKHAVFVTHNYMKEWTWKRIIFTYKWTALCKFFTCVLFGIGSNTMQSTWSMKMKNLEHQESIFCEQNNRG